MAVFSYYYYYYYFFDCAARGILVPWPEIKPMPLAVEARCPNHWVTGEVPCSILCRKLVGKIIYTRIDTCRCITVGFPGGSVVKNLLAMQVMRPQSLGWEDPQEKKMASHSSILAWKIPRAEEPGEVQSMSSQRSRTQLSNWTTTICITGFFCCVPVSMHNIVSQLSSSIKH